MPCPLCEREPITECKYEDNIVWCPMCKTHPDKVMIVLKRHDKNPTSEEMEYMEMIAKTKFPTVKFRGPASILDHFHLHQL